MGQENFLVEQCKCSDVEENTYFTENDPRFESAMDDISESFDRISIEHELTLSERLYLLVRLVKWQAEKLMYLEDTKA